MNKIIQILNSQPSQWWQKRGTAFYVYCESQLENNINQARQFLNSLNLPSNANTNSKIFFSLKANPNAHVLSALSSQGVGADVSSELELDLALRCGFDSDRISLSGPAKPDRLINLAIDSEIACIHIDSFEEWNFLRRQFAEKSIKFSVRLALQEGFKQKLGIPDQDLHRILSEIQANNLTPSKGIHIYLGRESFSIQQLIWLNDKIQNWWRLYPDSFVKEPELFLGAGLPPLDFYHNSTSENPIPGWKINLEGGRVLAHTAGIYVAQVLARKDDPNGGVILIIDGGFQHMASHLGSPRDGFANVKVQIFSSESTDPNDLVNAIVFGSLGVVHDKVYEGPISRNIKRGDWLVMGPAGTYGFTAASNQFLGLGQCQEFFYKTNGELLESSPQNRMTYQEATFEI